ncbi:MAG: MFS transporter [Lachnospiraceae bacterium]|nr:MFS transporter [Lachnospiraceae bacterium]
MAWQTRGISIGCVVVIVTAYLSLYCTNVLGLSPMLVGSLLMASKIFDSFTDLAAGYIVDNTHTRFGQGRTYEPAIICAWICTYALFCTPEKWGTTGKAIWIFIMYTMVFSVFQTLLAAAETPYYIRAFRTPEAIAKVAATGGIVLSLGCMVVSMTFPIFVARIGNTSSEWGRLVGMYAIPLALLGILRFVFVKEKEPEGSGDTEKQPEEKVHFRDILLMLRKNRYVWLLAITATVPQLVQGMAVGAYYFTSVVGNLSLYSIIQMCSIVMLLFMFAFPALMRKHSVMSLTMYSSILAIFGYLLLFLANKNVILLVIGTIVSGIATLPMSYMRPPVIMQLSDYNVSRDLPKMEASISAVVNFFVKVGGAAGSFLMGLLLQIGGYVGTAEVQTDSAVMVIRIAYGLIPAVLMLIPIICCILFRPLDEMNAEKQQ